MVESKVRSAHYVAKITRQNLDAHNLEMTSTHADLKETEVLKIFVSLAKEDGEIEENTIRVLESNQPRLHVHTFAQNGGHATLCVDWQEVSLHLRLSTK